MIQNESNSEAFKHSQVLEDATTSRSTSSSPFTSPVECSTGQASDGSAQMWHHLICVLFCWWNPKQIALLVFWILGLGRGGGVRGEGWEQESTGYRIEWGQVKSVFKVSPSLPLLSSEGAFGRSMEDALYQRPQIKRPRKGHPSEEHHRHRAWLSRRVSVLDCSSLQSLGCIGSAPVRVGGRLSQRGLTDKTFGTAHSWACKTHNSF